MPPVRIEPPTTRHVVVRAPATRRADPAGVATALGADAVDRVPAGSDTPLGFVAVRQALLEGLRSTGGRPGLAGVERRKIPVTEPAWRIVEQIARDMAEDDFHPSPAQVASVMLTLAARTMDPAVVRSAKHAMKASRTLGRPKGPARTG